MMELQTGRPADSTGRIQEEQKTYDLLDSLGIAYGRLDHEPAMTMEICKEIDESLQAVICKNLFLCNRQQTDFYLLMMPGDKPFKTKDLSAQIGSSRLSFASAEKMQELLHISPGSVSVMGLMFDTENKVQLLVDKDVLTHEFFGCHPCINTSSLRFSVKDLTEKLIPALKHKPRLVELPNYTEE